MVTNTFAYNERHESSDDNTGRWRTMKNLVAGSHPIPEPVLALQVKIGKKTKGARVDAVLVVEHKNVLEFMAEGDHAVKHVIMIMVSTSKSKGASLI